MGAPIIGAIGKGLESFGGSMQSAAQQRMSVENMQAAQADRFRYDVLNQMQFKPLSPYATVGKGRLLAGIMRAWGMEDMVGKDLLNYIGDPMNVPGTQGIGGKGNLQGVGATGIKAPKYKTGFGGKLGLFGAIMKGVGSAMSSGPGG